jgi:hypothetical protein
VPSPQPPTASVTPIQFQHLSAEDFKDPTAGTFNLWASQLTNLVNNIAGSAGRTMLPAGVDVAGSTVSGIGEPSSPSDAVSKAHAEANYSAAALAPQLEAGQKNSLKTMRRLNDTNQQESYSTYLNKLSNTSPTTNDTVVTAGAPSAGTVTITIPAGNHYFPDGTIVPFGTYSATVPVPSTYTITSLARVSGVVTASGASFGSLVGGEFVYIAGASDSSFDGNFELATAGGTSLTWGQPGFANGTATGGTVSTGGAYFFYLRNPSHTLAISGPFAQDSQLNRLNANIDQQVLIAVAVVNSSGLVSTQSAGGATVPVAQNNGNRILARL